MAAGTYDADAGEEGIVLDRDVTLTGGWDAGFVAQTGTSVVDGKGEQWQGGISVWNTVVARIDHVTVQNSGRPGSPIEGELILRHSAVQGADATRHQERRPSDRGRQRDCGQHRLDRHWQPVSATEAR